MYCTLSDCLNNIEMKTNIFFVLFNDMVFFLVESNTVPKILYLFRKYERHEHTVYHSVELNIQDLVGLTVVEDSVQRHVRELIRYKVRGHENVRLYLQLSLYAV